MEKSARHTVAMVMTAVYLLVIMAPLAPALLHSPHLAHALTGECSGDCRVCGCAPERSAAHACCCWQKKRIEDRRNAATGGSCCRTAPLPPPVATGGGCAGRKTAPPPVTVTSCCSKKTVLTDDAGESRQHEPSSETAITATPCGSGKLLALAASEKIQHLPYVFATPPPCQPATPSRSIPGKHLTSLPGEPPDPPPKLSSLT